MSGFTTGPWIWDENISGEKIGISIKGGRDVLYVNHSEGVLVPREKDEHLITAAPELYEALQRLVNVSAEIAPDVQSASVFADARAALEKARGES